MLWRNFIANAKLPASSIQKGNISQQRLLIFCGVGFCPHHAANDIFLWRDEPMDGWISMSVHLLSRIFSGKADIM